MATNIKSYPNLIDGTWKTSSDTPLEDRKPADYAAWSRTPAPARGAMLDKASQILTSRLVDIATVLTREEGKTLAEAKEEVTCFGLSAGVVTNNLKEAFAFANQVDAGVLKINEPTTGLALNALFGEFKGSSANTFKEQGQAAVDFYTHTKTLYINHG